MFTGRDARVVDGFSKWFGVHVDRKGNGKPPNRGENSVGGSPRGSLIRSRGLLTSHVAGWSQRCIQGKRRDTRIVTRG